MRFPRHLLYSFASAMALLSGVSPLAAGAAEPAAEPRAAVRPPQAPGVYRYRLGDFQLTALSDGSVPVEMHAVLQGLTKEQIDKQLERAFLSNPVETSVTAFLIDTGSRLILVDTGAGMLFGAGVGNHLLGNLKAAGYAPEQIDDILISHIHVDHSGGLAVEGQMLFPRATVHVGKADVDFFLDPAHQEGVEGYDKRYFAGALKTVGPYVKAGKVHTFTEETQLLPGIKAIPAPGHTPGHSFYRVESKGEAVLFLGDSIHLAPVQFPNPSITVAFDYRPKEAAAQRVKHFAPLAKSRILVAGPHLPYPGLGHLRAEEQGYTFVPVDYRDR